jgi:hypothetical protein
MSEKIHMNQCLALIVHSLFRFFPISVKKVLEHAGAFIHSGCGHGSWGAVQSHRAQQRSSLASVTAAQVLAATSHRNAVFA